jgi:hypothetical protein
MGQGRRVTHMRRPAGVLSPERILVPVAPLQQFYTWVPGYLGTWVGRMKPEEVPVDERATVKAQVVEIKARLEQLERALEETETPQGP